MTYEMDLTTLRRYTRDEAATTLNIPATWLKVWVTAGQVPHQRSGKPGPRQRGVWFTYDDLVAIGRMLPELMSGRQANSRVEIDVVVSESLAGRCDAGEQDIVAPVVGVIPDADFAAFSDLASLRSS